MVWCTADQWKQRGQRENGAGGTDTETYVMEADFSLFMKSSMNLDLESEGSARTVVFRFADRGTGGYGREGGERTVNGTIKRETHLLDVRHIEKYYGNHGAATKALDQVSFRIQRGGICKHHGSVRLRKNHSAQLYLHH